MSYKAVSHVLMLPGIDPVDKCVLAVLAYHINHKKKGPICWPSKKTLCDITGLGRSAMTARLTGLQDKGYIKTTHRTMDTNVYDLTPVLNMTGRLAGPRGATQQYGGGLLAGTGGAMPTAVNIEGNIEENRETTSRSQEASAGNTSGDSEMKPRKAKEESSKAVLEALEKKRSTESVRPLAVWVNAVHLSKQFKRWMIENGYPCFGEFQPKQIGQLNNISKVFEPRGNVVPALWLAVRKWSNFRYYAAEYGAKFQPMAPEIKFLASWPHVLANFLGEHDAQVEAEKFVKSIAQPMVNTTVKPAPKFEAADMSDLVAEYDAQQAALPPKPKFKIEHGEMDLTGWVEEE